MKKDRRKEEEISEDYCFTCKDGGHLRVCDFKKCLKAYHPNCVGKDNLFLEDDDRWTCGLHSCNCGKSSSFQCFCCPTSYCHSCITSAEFVQVKKNKGFCINCLRVAKMIEEDKHVDSDGEECQDLQQLVKKGLFKQPTVVELERKIRRVHEDIVNHWINREIAKLQNQIDRANEKGWRKELLECIDRRELLRTPKERMRLLNEIPEVIPDIGDTEAIMDEPVNLHGVHKESEPKSKSSENQVKENNDEEEYPRNQKTSEIEIIDLDDEDENDGAAVVSKRKRPRRTR